MWLSGDGLLSHLQFCDFIVIIVQEVHLKLSASIAL